MMDHWNRIYSTTAINKLGWYQEEPQPDLTLVNSLNLQKDANIVVAGAGSTTLVDHLLRLGYHQIKAIDISSAALENLQSRVNGMEGADKVRFICEDLTQSNLAETLESCDLWIDRAVLHFFTEENQLNMYQQLLHSIKPKHLLLAQFSTTGARKCSGLDVVQYDEQRLKDFVGDTYEENRIEHYTYINPGGDERPYIYGIYTLKH